MDVLNTLEVSDVPDALLDDNGTIIKTFFENTRKSGGGKIKSIHFNKTDATAVITFVDKQGKYMLSYVVYIIEFY